MGISNFFLRFMDLLGGILRHQRRPNKVSRYKKLSTTLAKVKINLRILLRNFVILEKVEFEEKKTSGKVKVCGGNMGFIGTKEMDNPS